MNEQELDALVERLQSLYEGMRSGRDPIKEFHEAKQAIDSLRAEVKRVREHFAEAQRGLSDAWGERDRAEAEVRRLTEENARLEQRNSTLRSLYEGAEKEHDSVAADRDALLRDNARLGELVEELGEYKARWNAAQNALDTVEAEGSEVVRINAMRYVLAMRAGVVHSQADRDALLRAVASLEQVRDMRVEYRRGGRGFGYFTEGGGEPVTRMKEMAATALDALPEHLRSPDA